MNHLDEVLTAWAVCKASSKEGFVYFIVENHFAFSSHFAVFKMLSGTLYIVFNPSKNSPMHYNQRVANKELLLK